MQSFQLKATCRLNILMIIVLRAGVVGEREGTPMGCGCFLMDKDRWTNLKSKINFHSMKPSN
ncbi:hypothetical protein AB6A40_004105 [Gnathostoma spinigerum]|uniref:Uncharacterized protein n=1 Tax=Gnathostoma spinigerum TaxID=75299 RepID=A0ABD6EJ19_9BILA